tara:strand:- start:125 stop:328 length:204 start_codon:yes stop_codon:yes gene_type:complete
MKFPLKYTEIQKMFYYTEHLTKYSISNTAMILEKMNKNRQEEKKKKLIKNDMINFNQYSQYSKKLYK